MKLAQKYLFRSKYSLHEYLRNTDYIVFTATWYGGVGLLYIMDSINDDNSLDNIITRMESRVIKIVNNKQFTYEGKIHSSFYDIINGLSGVGIYFLNKDSSKYFESLQYINKKIVSLLEMTLESNQNIQIIDDKIDYSISHGILGAIFYLSKFYNDFKDEKLFRIINKYLKVYKLHLFDEEPYLFLFPMYEKVVDKRRYYQYPNRVSWCYGSIGIYRALYLISININDMELKTLILNNIKKFSQTEIEDLNLNCPTFCHGYSGVYYILSKFEDENPDLKLNSIIKKIKYCIWSYYNTDLPYCFPKYDYDKDGNLKYMEDKTSLIDGVVSICLTYLSIEKELQNDFFASSLALK